MATYEDGYRQALLDVTVVMTDGDPGTMVPGVMELWEKAGLGTMPGLALDQIVAMGGRELADVPSLAANPPERLAALIVNSLRDGTHVRARSGDIDVAWSEARERWLVTSPDDEHAAIGRGDWDQLQLVLARLLAGNTKGA